MELQYALSNKASVFLILLLTKSLTILDFLSLANIGITQLSAEITARQVRPVWLYTTAPILAHDIIGTFDHGVISMIAMLIVMTHKSRITLSCQYHLLANDLVRVVTGYKAPAGFHLCSSTVSLAGLNRSARNT